MLQHKGLIYFLLQGPNSGVLLFDEKTSRHYFERYQKDGLHALMEDNYSGAEPKLDKHQMSELEGYLEEHIFTDAKSIIAHIYKQGFDFTGLHIRTLFLYYWL